MERHARVGAFVTLFAFGCSICEAGLPASWRPLGPNNIGGRTRSFLTDPDNSNILWAGSAEGLWKSMDEGAHWIAVDDAHFGGKSVAALVRDPREPDVMYAGIGDLATGFTTPT